MFVIIFSFIYRPTTKVNDKKAAVKSSSKDNKEPKNNLIKMPLKKIANDIKVKANHTKFDDDEENIVEKNKSKIKVNNNNNNKNNNTNNDTGMKLHNKPKSNENDKKNNISSNTKPVITFEKKIEKKDKTPAIVKKTKEQFISKEEAKILYKSIPSANLSNKLISSSGDGSWWEAVEELSSNVEVPSYLIEGRRQNAISILEHAVKEHSNIKR